MTKVCLGPLQKPLEVLLYPKPKFRKVIFFMRLESAAEPAIIKIEPIKISYISLKLTCKEMTAEEILKVFYFP